MSTAARGKANVLRLAAASGSLVLCAGIRSLPADSITRMSLLAAVALGLGYGHITAGAIAGGARLRRHFAPSTTRVEWLAFCLSVGALLLAAYSAVANSTATLFLLGAVLFWHILENDVVLGEELAPRAQHARPVFSAGGAIGAAAATGIVAAVLPRDSFAVAIAATVLYHVFCWLGILIHRVLTGTMAADRFLRVVVVPHLAGLAMGLAAFAVAWREPSQPLLIVLSPSLYLFFAALHTAQGLIDRAWARHATHVAVKQIAA